MLEHAFDTAQYFLHLLQKNPNFVLVSTDPLPCLQVCFYWAKDGKLRKSDQNSMVTQKIARDLIPRGWMIDYAPGEKGKFLRVVISIQTRQETVEGLVKAIVDIGSNL
jgi:hypothetical protein